jgi:hypothetical protein
MTAVQNLTVQQLAALEIIVAGGTVAEAAAAGLITERQMYRWMRLPDFLAVMDEQRTVIVGHTRHKLAKLAAAAVDSIADCGLPIYPHRLRKNARGTLNPQAIRLAAAREVLDRIGVIAPKSPTEALDESSDPAELEAALRARGWTKVGE